MPKHQIFEIAHQLETLSADETRRQLGDLCHGDEQLASEVRRCLDDQHTGEQLLRELSDQFLEGASSLRYRGMAVGQYRLVQPLESGGFGDVWTASRDQAEPKYVIKFADTSVQRKALRNEAIALKATMPVAGVQQYIAHESNENLSYLVTQWEQGQPLANALRDKAILDPEPCFAQILATVSQLHGSNSQIPHPIAHGDVTPRNIILRSLDQKPVLIDFGSAFRERAAQPESASSTPEQTTQHDIQTRPHSHTPAYRVPEVTYGLKPQRTSDVYQLGLLAFELFSGQRYTDVCRGDSSDAWDTLTAQIGNRRTRVVRRALAWEPAQRYASAVQLETAWNRSAVPVALMSGMLVSVITGAILVGSMMDLTWHASTETSNGRGSDVSQNENQTVASLQPETQRPELELSGDAESDFTGLVAPAVRRYLNYDREESIELDQYATLKLTQLREAEDLVSSWLRAYSQTRLRRISQTRQLQSWLQSARSHVAVPVSLVLTGRDAPLSVRVSVGETQLESQQLFPRGTHAVPTEFMRVEASMHDVITVEIFDGDRMVWNQSYMLAMAFHRATRSNSLAIIVDHQDGWHVGGQFEVTIDPPPIQPRGPRQP